MRLTPDVPVAVLLGLNLGACRALRAAGVPVALVDDRSPRPSAAREIDRFFLCRPYSPALCDRAWCDQLCEIARTLGAGGRPVLFPASDPALLAVAAFAEPLERAFVLAWSGAETVVRVTDKARFAEWSAAHGVPVPPARVVRSTKELPEALTALPLPCIVKPHHTFLLEELEGRKLYRARSRDEAARVAEICLGHGLEVVLQVDVSGPRSTQWSLACLAERGRLVQVVLAEKLREVEQGAGTAMETLPMDPAVLQVGRSLCEKLGLDGLCEIELRPAPDGSPLVIEVNPRIWSQVRLPAAAGIDLLHAAYLKAIGQPLPAHDGYRAGVGWVRWRRDLAVCGGLLRRGEIGIGGLVRSLGRVRVVD